MEGGKERWRERDGGRDREMERERDGGRDRERNISYVVRIHAVDYKYFATM
jgi:hypothetical protein